MANTLKLEIITPDAVVYSEDVEMVTLPGVEGQLGILPQHIRLMTQMVPGEMIVRKSGRDDLFAVGGGSSKSRANACPSLPIWLLLRTKSTKPRSKKRVNAPKPGSGKRSLTKKWLPSMRLWLAR